MAITILGPSLASNSSNNRVHSVIIPKLPQLPRVTSWGWFGQNLDSCPSRTNFGWHFTEKRRSIVTDLPNKERVPITSRHNFEELCLASVLWPRFCSSQLLSNG